MLCVHTGSRVYVCYMLSFSIYTLSVNQKYCECLKSGNSQKNKRDSDWNKSGISHIKKICDVSGSLINYIRFFQKAFINRNCIYVGNAYYFMDYTLRTSIPFLNLSRYNFHNPCPSTSPDNIAHLYYSGYVLSEYIPMSRSPIVWNLCISCSLITTNYL